MVTPAFVRFNDSSRFIIVHFALLVAVMVLDRPAIAGPEISLREYAGGQVKKGVRTIGMGGDGATIGNYALVYRDAGGAILDIGVMRFSDTANFFGSSTNYGVSRIGSHTNHGVSLIV